MSDPFVVMLRLRLEAGSERDLNRYFARLEASGEGDDMTTPDGSGRFNVWLQVAAPSIQDALALAVRRALEGAVIDALGAPFALQLLGAEVEKQQVPDADAPLLAL